MIPPRSFGFVFGALIALLVSAILATWFYRAPPDLTVSGFFQGDMPTYACFGRMAAQSPTTLSYASPHDVREPPRAWLINLPITLLGWLFALGVSPKVIEHVVRIAFGAAMYGALAILLRRVFRTGPWLWAAFVIVGLGSGFAWLASIVELPSETLDPIRDWRSGVRRLELPYYWWFLDTFRNLMYPLELAYHAAIFGQIAALGSRRYRWSAFFYALACLSNPFAGIQASGVQLGALVLAIGAKPRPDARAMLASAAIAVTFVSYYGLLLPLDPIVASLQQQHAADLSAPLSLKSLVIGHGPALLAPLSLLDPAFRRAAWTRFVLVPVLVLAAWTLMLSQNSRFDLPIALMPMHFTRGYLHAALWIVVLAWLEFRLASVPRASIAIGALLVAITLPDAAMFLEDQYATMPHNASLVWDRNVEAVHRYLRRERRPRRIYLLSPTIGRQICAQTWHRVSHGTHLTTPQHALRQRQHAAFLADPTREPEAMRWADIQVPYARETAWIDALEASGRWRRELCNVDFCVYRRIRQSRESP